MITFKPSLSLLIAILSCSFIYANVVPTPKKVIKKKHQNRFLSDCATAQAQTDLSINNVRARLTTGGDMWWDGVNGQYIVPKVDTASGLAEVSAIYASGFWVGGFDPGGNLKTACQTYGHPSGNDDFWPGPLNYNEGTKAEICLQWDQFFKVTSVSIRQLQQNWEAAVAAGRTELNPDEIPDDIKGWPAFGNPYFADIHGFSLPIPEAGYSGLAHFWDVGGTPGIFEPQFGDFPIVETRGCTPFYPRSIPDEIVFWIFNDGGGVHTNSGGDPLRMEIQVHAYAYQANDQLNNMTFYDYRTVNRSVEDVDSLHLAIWVDPDLGCYLDDYIGCDPDRGLSYIYNADALDGGTDCNDCDGITTYCTEIPVIGIDYLRGPLDEFGNEIRMSSFTYYGTSVNFPPTSDPAQPIEYYRLMTGSWRDGTRFTYGGNGYNPLSNDYTNYAFPSAPNDPQGWSMCSENMSGSDYRFIQSMGPLLLRPGAINEFTFGVLYTPDMAYPCPDMSRFFQTDDYVQACFDNCFLQVEGLWAPDVDWVELDRQVVAILSNDKVFSNNYQEQYSEKDFKAPGSFRDSQFHYKFEGYQVFQIIDAEYLSDFSDPDQARLVAQVDLKNDVKTVYNWEATPNPNYGEPGEPVAIWSPVEKADGANTGIRHSFLIEEDQFATGNRALINHRDYYFSVIAYAYNDWQTFSQQHGEPTGQRNQYLASDKNIKVYRVTPRPIVHVSLNAKYGQGPVITRLEGAGVGSNFVEMSEASRAAILDGTFDERIEYLPGQGPIDVSIYNPLEIKNGDWQLSLKDDDLTDGQLAPDATWELKNLSNNEVIASARSIATLNEQIVGEHGFSIAIAQTEDAGDLQEGNGVLGIEVAYTEQGSTPWFNGIPDVAPPFDWIKTGGGEIDNNLDPAADFNSGLFPAYWQPYVLADYRAFSSGNFLISPAWDNMIRQPQVRARGPLQDLNNVDIFITPDKSKWSRCVIIETASRLFYDQNLGSGKPTEGDQAMMFLRKAPSVGKHDNDGDGLPDPDSENREGMGWFPGYAIDVETGERLNIFFGENSTYDCAALQAVGLEDYCDLIPSAGGGKGIGRDMLWNPTDDVFIDIETNGNPTDIYPFIAGGQHFIYATKQPYDGCEAIYRDLETGSSFSIVTPLSQITWTCMPLIQGDGLLPLGNGDQGLIPSEISFKLRVDNPYQVTAPTGENNGHSSYLFSFEGVEKFPLLSQEEVEEELDQINVVPNPYYGYSYYEDADTDQTIKVTNLPPKCQITFYTLDGRFVRSYQRDEQPGSAYGTGAASQQITPALEWDLKDAEGRRVASGTYLIHVDAEDKGERVLKLFAVARE